MTSFIRKYGSVFAILLMCLPAFGQTSNTGNGSGGGGGGGVTSITAGTGIAVNASTGAVTVTNNANTLTLRTVSVATAASLAVALPSGLVTNNWLVGCFGAWSKPTSVISCPSGFTSAVTGGQLTDGSTQTQAVLCVRQITGGESGTQTATASGSIAGSAAVLAQVTGPSNFTSPDATLSAGNATGGQWLLASPSGSFPVPDVNFSCMASNSGTSGPTTNLSVLGTPAGVSLSVGPAAATIGESVNGATSAIMAIAGELVH